MPERRESVDRAASAIIIHDQSIQRDAEWLADLLLHWRGGRGGRPALRLAESIRVTLRSRFAALALSEVRACPINRYPPKPTGWAARWRNITLGATLPS